MSLDLNPLATKAQKLVSGSAAGRYAFAAAVAVAALLVRLALDPILGPRSPYLPFVLGIIVAARIGGRGPGYAVTVLSTLASDWFFLQPLRSLDIAELHAVAALAVFLLTGLIVSRLVGDLHSALESATRAEAAVRHQTRLVDLSHDAIITMSAGRRIIGWNLGACEIYGYTAAEAVGKPIHEFLETSSATSTGEIDDTLQREGRWEGELSHTAKEGRRVLVESRHVLLRDEHGRPASILEINRDITLRARAEEERRRAEESLSREREFLDAIVTNAPYPIAVVQGRELRYTLANSAYAALVPDVQILGRPHAEVFPEAVAAGGGANLRKTIETGEPWIIDHFKTPSPGGPDRVWEGKAVRLPVTPGQTPSALIIAWDVTEQVERQQAIREREAMLDAFFSASPGTLNLFDEQLRYLDSDPISPGYFGLDRRSIVGKSLRELNPGSAERFLGPILRRVVESGRPESNVEFSERLPARGGEAAHFRASFFPVPLPGGRRGVGAMALEITEAKRAEDALRRRTAELDSLLANAPLGFAFFDRGHRFIRVNGELCRMDGFPEEAHLGKGVSEVVPAIAATVDPILDEVFANGGHVAREVTEGTPAEPRSTRHWLTVFYPVFAGRELSSVGACFFEITERKAAEQALRESEERYRALFDSMQEGFAVGEVICDPAGVPIDWRYVQVNDAMTSMLQLRREEIIGHTYRELYPHASWEYWVEGFGRVALTGRPERLEHYGSGTRRHYSAIVYSPAPRHFAAVLTDISEAKKSEERLREAQKLESVGLLAGGVAHDFNNLLTVIVGSATAALQERPACEYLNAIVSSAERAAHLTRQLLAYAGKGHFVRKAVNVSVLVSRSKELLAASVPRRVRLVCNLADDLPSVEEDPSRLEQIVMNLVINSGEAIPPKTDGLIEIATGASDIPAELAAQQSRYDIAPGKYVWLEVRDSGVGMDETILSRVFDPFFSTKFTGRGLGLAAVDGIVRSGRGFIEVHSSPGAGTAFRVFLPASEKAPAVEHTAPAGRRAVSSRSTILVVDDEEMVRRLARTILKRHGYDVMEARDGRHALQVLASASPLPSLVLLDLAMPVMGGDELIPILARDYPGVKVVISTGYAEEEARHAFGANLVAGFVQKPYTSISLTARIDGFLGGGPTRGWPAAPSSNP